MVSDSRWWRVDKQQSVASRSSGLHLAYADRRPVGSRSIQRGVSAARAFHQPGQPALRVGVSITATGYRTRPLRQRRPRCAGQRCFAGSATCGKLMPTTRAWPHYSMQRRSHASVQPRCRETAIWAALRTAVDGLCAYAPSLCARRDLACGRVGLGLPPRSASATPRWPAPPRGDCSWFCRKSRGTTGHACPRNESQLASA